MKQIILLTVAVVLLTSCGTTRITQKEERKQPFAPVLPEQTLEEVTKEVKDNIATKLRRGMTQEEILSWLGRIPHERNESTGSFGHREQWVFGFIDLYLYFDEGRLDSWQIQR